MKFYLPLTVFCLSTLSLIIHTVQCEETTQDGQWYSNLSVVVHHNGEVESCGSVARGSISDQFIQALSEAEDKYDMETSLTDGLANLLDNDGESMCGSAKDYGHNEDYDDDEYEDEDEYKYEVDEDGYDETLYSHCDRGPERTPILLDHGELMRTKIDTLPCRFYTREGLRIQNLDQLKAMAGKAAITPTQSCASPQDGDDASRQCDGEENNDSSYSAPSLSPTQEIHLYAVPAGRLFHFAPAFVGEIIQLDHMKLMPDASKPVRLKVLSTKPKVFDILNVFTKDEAESVVQRALAETSPTHKIQRSTTSGTGGQAGNVFNKRTSENGFDTSGTVALALKKRIFEVLGFDEYWNGHDDGLQVLRYNLTTAYVPHMDYLPISDTSEFDYDSGGIGGNRYATVLLYMTDIPEGGGGETVFSAIYPEGAKYQRKQAALSELRESGDADRAGITRGSWEEEMVATCRSKFSVKPFSGRAVLFYSQHPNGKQDYMSKHGGCPVLKGDKWAANLWVWNTPRQNFPGAPMREGTGIAKSVDPLQIKAVFRNSGKDASMANADLYYDEAMYWGKLSPDRPLSSNTYEGHRWNVKVDGKTVTSWVISGEPTQEFVL